MDTREILAKEKDCIEEHAPFCTAACPLRLDVRSMMGWVQKNNYEEAADVLYKNIYFPIIVSKTCTAPCMNFCKRIEVDQSLMIPQIENAVATYGHIVHKIEPFMKLNKKVAIIGAGVDGLSAAVSLYEKGFKVTIYERENNLGGGLYHSKVLTKGDLENDFRFLSDLEIEIKLGKEVGKDISFIELYSEYDAIYISANKFINGSDLEQDKKNHIKVIEETLQTSNEKVFVSRIDIAAQLENPIVFKMVEGKKAATSIDRFLKSVSLTASRVAEGNLDTKLFTSIEGIQKKNPIFPSNEIEGYTKEEALEEAGRCIICRCMECVKECIYLESFEKFPRKYIREIFNNLSTRGIGLRTAKDLINSCSLCGLCKELCPNGLNMGEINKAARQNMIKDNSMPLTIHDFPIKDMDFSNSEAASLCKHQPGKTESSYLFFPGCQLGATTPFYIQPMYEYLIANLEGGVGIKLGCCGAPADWAGRKDTYKGVMAQFRKEWDAMGKPTIITACSTCHKEFKEEIPEMNLISIWELYDKFGLPDVERNKGKIISIHDSCTARHEPKMQKSVRSILEKTGYSIEELKYSKDKTKCCGYGGLIFYGNKKLTETIVKGRISESKRDYVAYCIMCKNYFTLKNKPTHHILDIIYGNDTEVFSTKIPEPISQKRINRIRLKKELLSTLWDEKYIELDNNYYNIKINLNKQVIDDMEERLILDEDIQRVIEKAERTGNKTFNPKSGHFMASDKHDLITYWVEYIITDDRYEVFNAYSHRLKLIEE
ncbi:MAG: pyridine nucleotide-disulfide oxidoreductase/dicluster-binding protein [Eubacteriales bacterium]